MKEKWKTSSKDGCIGPPKKNSSKKFRNILCILFMIVSSLTIIDKPTFASSEKSGVNVDTPTKKEIIEYIKENPATIKDKTTYSIKPIQSNNFRIGQLEDRTLNSSLNMVNQIRFIAGLDPVVLDKQYSELAAASSLVNSVNDYLTHFPEQPKGMSNEIYELGYEGSSSSNIAMGYEYLNDSILHGYMNDGDDYNIEMMGHRRWILNPTMGATGFGSSGRYSAMYAFDHSNKGAEQSGVVWPAQIMPTEFFLSDYPWTITIGEEINKKNIVVTLTRVRDNKVWKFSDKSKDGYFNVNNDWYGQPGCITFRPDNIDAYKNGDVFNVVITGRKEKIQYQVEFFDINELQSIQIIGDNLRLEQGKKQQLKIEVIPSTYTDQLVTWKSSDKNIATVDSKGLVTGKSHGKVTITATHKTSGKKTTYPLSIIPNRVKITSLSLNSKNALVLKWTKISKSGGYDILIADNKKFTNAKKITLKGSDNVTSILSDIKSGKEYYVKVRAYYGSGSNKVNGFYSLYHNFKITK